MLIETNCSSSKCCGKYSMGFYRKLFDCVNSKNHLYSFTVFKTPLDFKILPKKTPSNLGMTMGHV